MPPGSNEPQRPRRAEQPARIWSLRKKTDASRHVLLSPLAPTLIEAQIEDAAKEQANTPARQLHGPAVQLASRKIFLSIRGRFQGQQAVCQPSDVHLPVPLCDSRVKCRAERIQGEARTQRRPQVGACRLHMRRSALQQSFKSDLTAARETAGHVVFLWNA